MKPSTVLTSKISSYLSPEHIQYIRSIHSRLKYHQRLKKVPNLDIDESDIIIVVVDSFREGNISGNGYGRETTPFLDTHGATSCIAPASWTYSSVPSILSGLLPRNHGAAYEQSFRNQDLSDPPYTVRKDVHLLPELLDATGYQIYFASAIATAEVPIHGHVRDPKIHHQDSAEKVISSFENWWKSTEKPRFAYLHLGDLHEPLCIPEEQPFGDIPNDNTLKQWEFTKSTTPSKEFRKYKSNKIKLYDTILRNVDAQIKRLVDIVKHDEGIDDAMIAITGDHGEEFWERIELEREYFEDPRGIYGVGHGHALIPEVVHVPLTLIGGRSPQLPEKRVAAIDIVPSILETLDSPSSLINSLDGMSLFNLPSEPRVFLSEEIAYGHNQIAVIREDDHLIYVPHTGNSILINEIDNSLTLNSEKIDELLEYAKGDRAFGDQANIDKTTEDRLSDLGYL